MNTLEFILSSPWNFIGTIILIFVIGANIANIFKSFRLIQIKYEQVKEPVSQAADYKKMWSDLISTWNKDKKEGGEQK